MEKLMLGNQHVHARLPSKELKFLNGLPPPRPPPPRITERFSDRLQNYGHVSKLAAAKQEKKAAMLGQSRYWFGQESW
jgi:hypothetical protein